ncbi:hypothetical protein [Nocardia brasiliensis]|uniref:Uncharacterized protein n=1 Tax=Nocardia brasiliensis (strain ATCC 700358 / HUJEG-1) TaxID=1133849 RepID=K0EUX8_NOCB7|nr:hypothetical protein [Nocardia brasiliensis]AFU00685.1 hypothetical protein O3I_013620 [Nocardia brasiliensis ATCC 700358]OCF83952.1 hypothetical protein AW168_02210 [Nocardia brasiliensis]
MLLLGKFTLTAAVSAAFLIPFFPDTASALPPAGTCAGGDFRWTAVDGAIDMSPNTLTFTSVGVLRDCSGGPEGITGGTFTGTHIATSDCMHPADGPITVDVLWSNGETSRLWGQWPVTMQQPTVGPLAVVAGLGQGSTVRITADYEMMTPEMIGGCLGPGLRTGVGRLSAATFQ